MEIKGYRLIAPWLVADEASEAEVLGMACTRIVTAMHRCTPCRRFCCR